MFEVGCDILRNDGLCIQVITNHSQQAAAARAAEDMLTPIDGRITEPTRSASPSLRQSTPLGSGRE